MTERQKIIGALLGSFWGLIIYLIFSSIGEVIQSHIFGFWDSIKILIIILVVAYIGSETKEFFRDESK